MYSTRVSQTKHDGVVQNLSGYALSISWVLAITMLVFASTRCVADTQHDQPASSEVDRQATAELIRLTANVEALCSNFDSIPAAPPRAETRLDDEALAMELTKRFCSAEWPQTQPFTDPSWREALPTPELQVLCWLAECNKRMCFGMPEVREQHQKTLMASVTSRLRGTADAAQIRGLLDVAYRTVFYQAPVIPSSGADELIDLFKQYVGNSDPTVHEFARERLRRMGYVYRARYDEVLNFLIEKAPEIRKYLTAKPVQGIPVDLLTCMDYRVGTVKEKDWLALDTMAPEALGAIVETRISSERSQDAYGYQALEKLTRDSVSADGDAAFAVVLDLSRKGIRTGSTLHFFALETANERDQSRRDVLCRRVERLVQVLPEAANSRWSLTRREPVEELEGVLRSVKEDAARRNKEGEPPSDGTMAVQQRLEDALKSLRKAGA